jgi:hypothetical protein
MKELISSCVVCFFTLSGGSAFESLAGYMSSLSKQFCLTFMGRCMVIYFYSKTN